MHKLESPDIWDNIKQVRNLGKEVVFLDKYIKKIDKLVQSLEELNEFLEIILEENFDLKIFYDIKKNLKNLEHDISELEFRIMFSKKYDYANCYMDIQFGSGGIDAQDWVEILLRMYLRWIEHKGFSSNIISESAGDIAGLKSVTLHIIGEYAYGWLRTEIGVHRLVRKSPFHSNSCRHTSFASVFVYPEYVNDEIDIKINITDLRFDVYRSSGAGGQHVNCTESAVRITHLPTNTVTQCQSDRSQHRNKEQAMKQLKSKLYNLKLQQKKIEKENLEKNKLEISWGNHIRSYILDASRVKDLRTGFETYNVRSVLDGDLDQFVIASLKFGL